MIIRTPQDIAAVVREQRRNCGWSQTELADHIGVRRQWVSDFERGKPTAHLVHVLKALQVLQITLDVGLPGESSVIDSGGAAADEQPHIDLDALLS